jgi:putative transposase
MDKVNKAQLARVLDVSRSSLYYAPKQPSKDWELKCRIENVLHEHPSYGHKRLALHLGINKKRVLRVMKLFGIEPYRRRGKKWKKPQGEQHNVVNNLLLATEPTHPNHIWVTDFTHIDWKNTRIYLCTMMDLFTRRIMGFSILTNHSVALVIQALFCAIHIHPRPNLLHSDRGSEYTSKDMQVLCDLLGIIQSMSRTGCPWENGYQESFYSQFKVDLGDPNRFDHLGEFVYELYRLIHVYNTSRIHTALKMPPETFHQSHVAQALIAQNANSSLQFEPHSCIVSV